MNIAAFFDPLLIIAAFLATLIGLVGLGKIGVIRNAFDPFMLTHIQLLFTTTLLSWAGLLPLEHVLYLAIVYVTMASYWDRSFRTGNAPHSGWKNCILLLTAISIPANLYLILTKGFILFQEDVGAAKVEFYQGVGMIRRINTALSVILPVHVFVTWSQQGKWTTRHTLGLLWSTFIILSLGSKAGITSLAFSYGAALYFQKEQPKASSAALIILLSIVSSFGMFYIVYGQEFLINLGVRIVAFADGPFYYFQDKMKLDVPFSYPFYIFAYAARLIDALPVSSLGPEINWHYFRLDDELYGPNPQIAVESIAIYGQAAIIHYLTFAAYLFLFARYVKNAYSFALWATFVRSFPVDSQLAYSNLYNVVFVGFLYAVAMVLSRFIPIATRLRREGA
jgi:hypothetical protein